MSDLSQEPCSACRPDAVAVCAAEQTQLLSQLPGWQIETRNAVAQLEKSYGFANFAQALAFTNALGAIAEAADHHPALLTEWGKVTVTWWSHSLKGLHRNDFIMAARTEQLATVAVGRR